MDEFTKYLFIIPVQNLKAHTTATVIIKNIFTKHGYPTTIHSDNGSSFANRVLAELCTLCGIDQTFSTPYHSQGNSVCERANSVVLNLLGTLPSNKRKTWYKYSDVAAYSYNTSIHSSTGFSPFYLLFGRKPRLIGDALLNINFEQPQFPSNKDYLNNLQLAHKLCKDRLEKERLTFIIIYDKKRHPLVMLEEGDVVLVKNFQMSSKIDNRWNDSPYIITGQPDPDIPVYELKELSTGQIKVYHRNQLLPLFQCTDIVGRPTKVKGHETETQTVSTADATNTGTSSSSEVNQSSDDSTSTRSSSPVEFIAENPSDHSSDSSDISDSNPPDDTYVTRSGRRSKPPDRYTPSKAILHAIFGY